MAKKIVETLVTELTADGAKLKKEMSKALQDAKSWGDKFKAITGKLAIGAGIGAAGLGAGVVALTKSAIDNADAMSKQSQSVGMALETLSAYSYAAEMGGVENDKFVASLAKFNRVTSEAFQGLGKGVGAYDALNISLTDSNGKLKNNSELFAEVAERFKNMPDGIQKTALATDLFGRSGADLIPVLNGGKQSLIEMTAEAERLGLVISTDTGKNAELFNDNLEKMQKAFKGLGLRIAEDALPALNDFTSTINDPKTQDGLASLATGAINFGTAIVSAAAKLATFTGQVGEFFAKSFHGIDVLNLKDLEEEIQDIRDVMESPLSSPFDPTIPRRLLFMSSEELEAELKRLTQIRDDINKGMYEAPVPAPKINAPSVAPSVEGNGGVKTLEEINAESADAELKILRDKMAAEDELLFDAALRKENKEREEARRKQEDIDRDVAMQKDKFSRIYEESLSAQNMQIELENYRHEQEKAELDKEMELLRTKLGDENALELEYQLAKEQQLDAHNARLKEIKDKEAEEDLQRRMAQLQGTEELFGNLYELSSTFGNKQSRLSKTFFALSRAASIAQAIVSIQTGVAKAQEKGWPAGLAEGIAVAAQGAKIIGTIRGTNIAHGGIDSVPKESTYLLDAGERVVSPKQNKDLTQFLKEPKQGSANVVVHNYAGAQVETRQNGNTVELIIKRVIDTIKDQVQRGNGIDSVFRTTYPSLVRRGS